MNNTRGALPAGNRTLSAALTFATMIAAPSSVSPGKFSGSGSTWYLPRVRIGTHHTRTVSELFSFNTCLGWLLSESLMFAPVQGGMNAEIVQRCKRNSEFVPVRRLSYRYELGKVYAKYNFHTNSVLCGRRYERVNRGKVYAKCTFSYPSNAVRMCKSLKGLCEIAFSYRYENFRTGKISRRSTQKYIFRTRAYCVEGSTNT